MSSNVPLSSPLYGASFGQAFVRVWAKYAVFSGRAGRAEYWWWVLASAVIALALEVVRFVLVGATLQAYLSAPPLSLRWTSVPWLAWVLVSFVPNQALGVRRLHDSGRSGWWQLLSSLVVAATFVQSHLAASAYPVVPTARPLEGGPLLVSSLASIVSLITAVVLIIFYTAAPNRAGDRFDVRRDAPDPRT